MNGSVGESVLEAEALIRSRDYPEAIQLLTAALVRAPERRDARSALALAHFRSQSYDAAAREYGRLMDSDRSDAYAAYNLGLALQELGRNDEAGSAFESALRARPSFPEAEKRLAALRTGSEPALRSLAEMLDDRDSPPPDDDVLAGDAIYAGRPMPYLPLSGLVLAILALLAPLFLHQLASSVPAGWFRDFLAWSWHVAAAISLPLVVVLLIVALLAWLNTWMVVRSRRVEVTRGALIRRHLVLWYHESERQVIFRQSFIEMIFGLGSIDIWSGALPGKRRFLPLLMGLPNTEPATGRLHLGSLPVARAQGLARYIRAAVLWERRSMLNTFITNR